jgi:hypothetical protein
MSRLLRILCLWLAAIALPVQGLAAATMIHCGPAHPGSTDAVARQGGHVHADGTRHVHGTASALPGGDGDRVASKQQASVSDTGLHATAKTVGELHKLSKSKCASCVSCCSATALPSALFSLDSPPLAESLVPVLSGSLAVFLTDGPERPPRFLLA